MQRWLIVIGAILIAIGLAWPLLSRIPFGRLPGDMTIERENFSLHLPLMTSIIVSLVITIILWIFRR